MRLYEVLEVCVVLANNINHVPDSNIIMIYMIYYNVNIWMCVVTANNIKHFPDSEEKSVSPPKIFYSAAPWGKKMPCAQPGIKDNLHLQGKF